MTRVLITGGGGPAAVSFIKATREMAPDLFVADMDHLAAGLFLVDPLRRVLLPAGDAPEFVSRLLRVCIQERIDVLIPTVDAELLAISAARRQFVNAGVRVLLAEHETLRTCIDKYALARLCRGHVRVPRTEIFRPSTKLDDWTFPVVLKPRSGSGSRGVRIVHRPEDLPREHCGEGLLIQEYLPGEEYSVDVLATPFARILAAVPRIRLRIDSGVAVASRTVHDEELEALARTVSSLLALTHVANVQFRRTVDGELALLEVNPRFPGTMPLTVAAGVNMPAIALAQVIGEEVPVPTRFREVGVVRYLEECFVPLDEFCPISERETLVPAKAS